MPVSKTDSLAGTLKGRYKAFRRGFRDRKAVKRGREIIEADLQRDRIRRFWNRVNRDGETMRDHPWQKWIDKKPQV